MCVCVCVYLDVPGLNAYDAYLKIYILWMKTILYPNKIRPQVVTIVPMTPFTRN